MKKNINTFTVCLLGALMVFAFAFHESYADEALTGSAAVHNIDSLTTLLEAIKDSDPKNRSTAAEQLGRTGSPQAVVPLIKVLEQDDVWSVRKWAAWALGEIKDRQAVPPLIRALKHSDWIIRARAAEALGKIADNRAVEPLINTLHDESSHVYAQATWALGEICDDRALDPLIGALENDIPAVRANAAKALGKMKSSSAIERLAAVMKSDRVAQVRKWSAWALGEIKVSRTVQPLIDMLKDNDYYVRMQAELSLEKIGKPAVPLLIAALNERSHHVYMRSGWALQEITGQKLGHDMEAWLKWLLESSGYPVVQ